MYIYIFIFFVSAICFFPDFIPNLTPEFHSSLLMKFFFPSSATFLLLSLLLASTILPTEAYQSKKSPNIFSSSSRLSSVKSIFGSFLVAGALLTALDSSGFINMGNSASAVNSQGFPVLGSEEIMRAKSHGTSDQAVQSKLRWNVDVKLADRISNYNVITY